MMRRMVCVIAIGLVVAAVTSKAAEPQKEKAAVSAAERWLALLDDGKYGESWKEAAEYFRNAVGAQQWEQSAQAVRRPLGKLVARKAQRTTYKTSLPGAPDGEYVVIEFSSSFENKK